MKHICRIGMWDLGHEMNTFHEFIQMISFCQIYPAVHYTSCYNNYIPCLFAFYFYYYLYFLVWTATRFIDSCWGFEISLANKKRSNHIDQNENRLHLFSLFALHSCIVIIVTLSSVASRFFGALSSVGIFPFEKHLYDHWITMETKEKCISFIWTLISPNLIIFNRVR